MPGSYYFMEKVANYRANVFDAETTKQSLIEDFEQMEDDENLEEFADGVLEYELLDSIFNNNLTSHLFNIETGAQITREEIIAKIKEYDLAESEVESIVDYESIAYTYDWDFLNCRIEALREFARKQLKEMRALPA
jgi:hypothetical protein